ncbi:Hypothetical predicted protein [Olea europaea subsp. europaea]|uniref:Uncharacterized protein n=1 Tax=Olea europaea subsp. europaea TaxID=158383 RepID=A0A8S0QUT2_OLEEU|nr:Hypothetical predicted protein [Olea europaea subsp. europaea]
MVWGLWDLGLESWTSGIKFLWRLGIHNIHDETPQLGLHSRLPGSRLPGFQGLAPTDENLKSNTKNLNFSASRSPTDRTSNSFYISFRPFVLTGLWCFWKILRF